ncbi:hypothetical protein A3731_26065 [Roseovarius sp. HI0049]|nr:hypothetical protein A3731_26065 [Roseovarius sp. HI0049]
MSRVWRRPGPAFSLAGGGLDDVLTDEEAGVADEHNEGFVIGVDVQARAFADGVGAVGEDGVGRPAAGYTDFANREGFFAGGVALGR